MEIPTLLLIVGAIVGCIMAFWFNYSIHQEIQRRMGIGSSNRIIPIVEAREINGELPVDTVIIVIDAEQV
tara:strand:- start:8121 stop:8330 length:210 start_codon:yes stop_codon:yes gene_type:complete